ncbi:MAG: tetratricopeptide repeat protein [Parvibaculum sp.]|nr:tetratricopeptide repeat protein [Parvibaculum sp.]
MANSAMKRKDDTSEKIDRILDGAMTLQTQGMLKEAGNLYRKVLKKFPGHPGTLRLMGILAHQSGRSNAEAIKYIRDALDADPDFAHAHKNLGFLLVKEGLIDEAIFHFSEAARLLPDDIESRLEIARLLDEGGESRDALEVYREIIAINDTDARAFRGIGKILSVSEDEDELAESFDALHKAIAKAPKDHITVLHAATLFVIMKKTDDAIAAFESAIKLNPNSHEAHFAFANLMRDNGHTQRAVDLFSRAIELSPKYAAAYSNLGNMLADNAMLDDAIACANQAIALSPDLVEAHNNLGSALQNACRPAEALDAYTKALTLRPNDDAMLWNFALCLLATGQIENGWDIYGYGFASGQRKPYRPFPGLIWQGEDLSDKTIMITREQGLGDDLRFSTCFHDIIAEAKHVIIETDKRFVDLYQRTWPQATVRAETGRSTGLRTYKDGEVDFDYTAPAGIIAAMRRRALTSFPRESRPLVANPARRETARAWLDSLGSGPKIGLTWRSGLHTPLRDMLATDPIDWAAIQDIDGAKLINLQFGFPDAEIREAAEKHGLTIHQMPDLDTHNDLEGTAALTAELDFVVGLWNAATEMAGALGVKGVIYMPAHHPMQLGLGILPWHPSLRTYSVMPGFDHKGLVQSIANDVRALLSPRS